MEGTYSDGSVEDLTSSVTFSTSAASVVSIDASGVTAGLATGAGVGTAQISALVDGFTAQTGQITVTAATLVSIAITPSSPSFAAGTTQQFTAIGTFSDGSTQDLSSQVVWSSSNPQTLTISGTGLASAGDPGSVIVSANFGGVTVSTGTVDVTSAVLTGLTLSPLSAQVAEGTTQQFVAMGSFSDGSSQDLTPTVSWTSSNAQVASINAAGLAKGTGVGSATIMAATQGKAASTTSFTVTAATLVSIAFDPPESKFFSGDEWSDFSHWNVLGRID